MSNYADQLQAIMSALARDLTLTPHEKWAEVCPMLSDIINDARDKFIAIDEAEMDLQDKRSERVA